MAPSRSCLRTTVQGRSSRIAAPRRWAQSEEIGWVHSQEIRWVQSQEIGWAQSEEILQFLLSGLGKLGAYSATAAYMSATGVPGAWLPAVIAIEIFGSLAIVLGWKTRVAALLLAAFSVLTALTFHNNLADQIQMIMFFKNLSIAGGFLLLAANGAGPLSLDRRAAKQDSR